jgi:hypothetical protein
VTWELCDAHVGTADDFAKLDAAITAADIRRSALQAMRAEIAACFNTAQQILRNPETGKDLFPMFVRFLENEHKTLARLIQRLAFAIPAGICNSNASVLIEQEFRHVLRPLRDQDWLAVLQGCTAWEKETAAAEANLWRNPSFFFASFAGPALSNAFRKLAYTEALTAQAVIACALERHQIRTGEYPETLDSLQRADGSPLPPDIMTGQPMRYRREANGRYTLWSVGFDGKDDGAKRNLDPKNPEATRFFSANYAGDWVWDFPSK